MERRTKIILISVGGVLILTAISIGLYIKYNTPNEDEEKRNDEPNVDESKGNSGVNGTDETTPDTTPDSTVINDGLTRPTFNTENELSNSFSSIKGHYLYPKRKEQGGWGYANVRSSALVNNNTSWWTDGISNLITTIYKGTTIGTVISQTTGVYNGYSYRWFKVKLSRPTGGVFSAYTVGYVRADTVTFKTF
jgi:hypothetical protein